MRPRIVDWLNQSFHTDVFAYLVPNYTIMFSLALLVVLFLFIRRVRFAKLDVDVALRLFFWATVGIVAGGKLYGVLMLWIWQGELVLDILLPSRVGMFSMGGVIGGLALIVYFALIKKINPVPYLDTVAPYAPIAVCLMRIGCFLNGDDYGRVSFVPWAVQYPEGSYPHQDQVAMGLITYDSPMSLPLHPVQLYLSAAGLLIFLLLRWTRQYQRLGGEQFALLLGLYFSFRFVMEFYRGDPMRFYLGSFSDAQLLGLIIAPLALLFIFVRRRLVAAGNAAVLRGQGGC